MTPQFKDHFSNRSDDYRNYRPVYPQALFDLLNSLVSPKTLAWDCATGTGQCALSLAETFPRVIATDASPAQIDTAIAHDRIHYHVALAEDSPLETSSVDLVTVAQALHWFDLPAFFREVDRVLRPGGLLAIWTYHLLSVNPTVDELISDLYSQTLMDHWPKERRLLEDGYRSISLPYERLAASKIAMKAKWNLDQLCGYLKTWSAVKAYTEQRGFNPIDKLSTALRTAWGPGQDKHEVSWPLTVYLCKKS